MWDHLSRAFRPARARAPRPVILMYHRIAEPAFDPWGLAVSPARFAEQIEYLAACRQPLTMDDFAMQLRRGNLPDRAVAVTFDDGYRDNLSGAFPVLERYRVPATLFVVTGTVERPAPFWWDELASMILGHAGPAEGEIEIAGLRHGLAWGPAAGASAHSAWRTDEGPHNAQQASYLAIWTALRDAGCVLRERVMDELRHLLGSRDLRAEFPMDAAELRRITASGLVALGAHTIRHPALTTLAPEERRSEIVGSRAAVAGLIGRPPTGFAYPYGNLDKAARDDVVAAGFDWAVSTDRAPVGPNADCFRLPRFMAQNWGRDDMARALAFL